MSKTAVVTGFTGQDGSYLAELLLNKGYAVVGHVRPLAAARHVGPAGAARDLGCSEHLRGRVQICSFPETSQAHWCELLEREQPIEIYHLGATTSVRDSWNDPLAVNRANVDWTTILLEATRLHSPKSKLFFACSSEVFGSQAQCPQNESTPMQPRTPYGVSKAAGHWLVQSYRQRYGMYLCSGILFNHESPRRPESFVSRKITRGAARIKQGLSDSLEMGDLSVRRDWGYAGDFVDAMWRMLQQDTAEDFVIGTGQLHCAGDMVELAFGQLGLDWQQHVTINPAFFRAHDPRTVVADNEKARTQLAWTPHTTLEQLVEIMVRADMDALADFRHNTAAA